MTIPSQFEVTLPLLQYAATQDEFKTQDAIEVLAKQFRLTDEERREMLDSGRHRRFDNRVWFARLALKKSGLIERTPNKKLRITDSGREVLQNPPEKIDRKYMMQFPEYKKLWDKVREKQKNKRSHPNAEPDVELENPEEQIEYYYRHLNDDLAQELLEKLTETPPQFFEQVVVDLLVSMGYGGSRKDAAEATRLTADDGIDGVIKEDKLGLDAIYIQAKRYAVGNGVGRPAVQAFAGSLEGNRARKGVFITTSHFTKDAHQFVERIEKKIILIDGAQLTRLMIEHNIGVSEEARYVVKKIDHDYFEQE